MAINQKFIALTEHDDESQGSTHSSYCSGSSSDEESLSCSEHGGEHSDIDMVLKTIRRRRRGRSRVSAPCHVPASLRASRTCGKKSQRARQLLVNAITNGNTNSNAESTPIMMKMMKRLQCQLDSLRSLLPPTARSSRSCSIIADALKYRKALDKEIELLLSALPYSQQVHVRRVECGGLHIGISCQKKSGLMVALMEAMESFGLHFANMSVSCQDDNITIDALSTQESVGRAGVLKGMLVATITRFSGRP